tara:strand:+ start:11146 stop:12771 length:1626 start_codon:yes stop_codon:yes gene_type:complete
MATEKIGVEIEVKSKGAGAAFRELSGDIKKFNKDLDKNRDGLKALDTITGGAVSQIKSMSKMYKGAVIAVKGFSKSLNVMKGALLATGIGALVVALGTVIAYWDDIKSVMSGVSSESKDILENQTNTTNLAQQNLDTLSSSENILKQQGKTDKEILQLKIAQTGETIKSLTAQLETQIEQRQAQKETAQRQQKFLAGLLQLVTGPVSWILKAYDKITGSNSSQIFDKMASMIISDEDEDADAAIETAKKRLLNLQNSKAGMELTITNNETKERQKRKQIADDFRKKDLDADIKLAADKLALFVKDTEMVAGLRRSNWEANLEETKANDAMLLELERQRLLDQVNESTASDFMKKLALEEINENFDSQIEASNEEYDDRETAREKAVASQKVDLMKQTFGTLAEVLGKNSAAGKAAAIAAATINTYQGISEIWGNKSTLPAPFDVIQKGVASVAVLASGLKTVKQIKQVPKPKGVKGGGGGGGGGAPSFTPPAFNVVGAGGTSNLAGAIADQENRPSRSYVVAGDVTTAQELERNTINESSI